MTAFVFSELVPQEDVISTALGTSTSTKFALVDLGKAVKLGTAQNYVPPASGDDIEGIVVAIEPFTVNDGFSFGSVATEGRFQATAGGAISIGGYVVSGTPVALGTEGVATVIAGAPAKFFWRVIRNITSPGNAAANGHTVLIEKVS